MTDQLTAAYRRNSELQDRLDARDGDVTVALCVGAVSGALMALAIMLLASWVLA